LGPAAALVLTEANSKALDQMHVDLDPCRPLVAEGGPPEPRQDPREQGFEDLCAAQRRARSEARKKNNLSGEGNFRE
jgi:hypothetical protein